MDTDTVHALLADEDRRAVLKCLATNGGTATVLALAQRLTGDTGRIAGTGAGDARVRLHHVHLPKLAEAGAIEYESDASWVTLTAEGRRLEELRRETVAILEDSS